MYTLPTYVELNEESFHIRNDGDFRMILHLFNIFEAEDLSEEEKIIASIMWFYEDFETVEEVIEYSYSFDLNDLILKIYEFINCGQKQPEENASKVKLIDWEKDATLISSAINSVAGKEIRAEEYIHWWTFIGYYMAIGECALSQIVSIRYKVSKNKPLEKYEKKFMIENPQYFNVETKPVKDEIDLYLEKLWNGGND